MPKSMTLNDAYLKCDSDGFFIPQKDVDIGKITSMMEIAQEDMESIEELKNKERYNTVYKLGYDVLYALAEAFLLSYKMKTMNHQCLFAYLCTKFPELEFDWDFFEKIRTKRNGIHYYGSSVTGKDWKDISIQITLYINTLKKEINKKIEDF